MQPLPTHVPSFRWISWHCCCLPSVQRRRAATAPSRSGNLTGEELVGRRVGILWADDAAMYYGKLTAYNSKNVSVQAG